MLFSKAGTEQKPNQYTSQEMVILFPCEQAGQPPPEEHGPKDLGPKCPPHEGEGDEPFDMMATAGPQVCAQDGRDRSLTPQQGKGGLRVEEDIRPPCQTSAATEKDHEKIMTLPRLDVIPKEP